MKSPVEQLRVIEGLPELLRAIADAQVVLAAQMRKSSANTEHYRMLMRTGAAMTAMVELFVRGQFILKIPA